MSAVRLLFSSDVFLPRGYALGWEPALLLADAASELLLAAGAAALLVRALRRRPRATTGTAAPAAPDARQAPFETATRSRGLILFSALLCLSALVEIVAIWRFWPGISALLRGAAGCTALFACRAGRASSSPGR